MIKKLVILFIVVLLTGCGQQDSKDCEVPDNQAIHKSGVVDSSVEIEQNEIDGFLLKSYDVEGNFIGEIIKVTNVYREMPDFVVTDRIPTAGTHFECVEYKLDHSPMEEFYYVNIYVNDVDGQSILCEGKEYARRTYDYFDLMTEDYEKIYCYYEIPDGLKEYSLEFVNQIESNSNRLYLRITTD